MLSAVAANDAGTGAADKRALRFRLARLLCCSELMLNCARQGDWESVEMMERERRADLEECFARALDVDASQEVREAIAALMHVNDQMVQLVAQARQAALQRRQTLGRGRQAAQTYRRGRENLGSPKLPL